MSLIVDQRGIRGLESISVAAPKVDVTENKRKPVAWVYECRQPGEDKNNWVEFFSREEPANPEGKSNWLRNIRPLFGDDNSVAHSLVTPAPEIDLSSLERYEESNMEGGGVYPDSKGPFVRLAHVHEAIAKAEMSVAADKMEAVNLREDDRFSELLSEYGDSFASLSGSLDPEPLIQYIEQRFHGSIGALTVLTDAQIDDMSFGYCPSGEIGELRDLCRAVEAAMISSQPQRESASISMRDSILQAITRCGHKIDDQSVKLFATNNEEGNALSQLMDRIMAIIPTSQPTPERVRPEMDLTAMGLMNLWRRAETLASMQTPAFVLYARMLLADAQPPTQSHRAELTEEMQQKLDRYEWIAARFTGYDFYWGGNALSELEKDKGKCVIVIECGQDFPAQRNIEKAIDSVLKSSKKKIKS